MGAERGVVMRLIDADALSAFVGDLRSVLHKEQSTFKAMTDIEFNTRDYMLLNFQYAIDNAPTVERPQGEWSDESKDSLLCSACGKRVYKPFIGGFPTERTSHYYPNFCAFCGADMRGGRE